MQNYDSERPALLNTKFGTQLPTIRNVCTKLQTKHASWWKVQNIEEKSKIAWPSTMKHGWQNQFSSESHKEPAYWSPATWTKFSNSMRSRFFISSNARWTSLCLLFLSLVCRHSMPLIRHCRYRAAVVPKSAVVAELIFLTGKLYFLSQIHLNIQLHKYIRFLWITHTLAYNPEA